jgi:hypothetical protein
VHDTASEVAGVNHFKIFMDKLYCVYHMSPRNRTELHACARELGVQLLAIGKMLDTRWIASSVRTIRAVWQNYAALHAHFVRASEAQNSGRDSKERAMYAGLAKRISTHEFVGNLGTLYDACQELSELSTELQKRTLSLPDGHRAIARQVRVLESMIDRRGEFSAETLLAEQHNTFKGVTLHPGSKCDAKINHKQFFRSLSTNLRTRMINVTTNDQLRMLVEDLKVLYPANWPDDVPATYGEESIVRLARRFKVDERPAVRAFREYTSNGGRAVPGDLRSLFISSATLPVSTAECERGFSQMNLIMTPSRNALATPTLAALLFIKLVGPPLGQFKPAEYVKSWLILGHHAADDTNCMTKRDIDEVSDYQPLWSFL